jgi:hypothetical protein
MTQVNVRFNPDRSRWEALQDGEELGFLDYQVNCGVVELSRTEVGVDADDQKPGFVELALIRAGLEQASDDGLRVLASSPQVEDYLDDHADEFGHLR